MWNEGAMSTTTLTHAVQMLSMDTPIILCSVIMTLRFLDLSEKENYIKLCYYSPSVFPELAQYAHYMGHV